MMYCGWSAAGAAWHSASTGAAAVATMSDGGGWIENAHAASAAITRRTARRWENVLITRCPVQTQGRKVLPSRNLDRIALTKRDTASTHPACAAWISAEFCRVRAAYFDPGTQIRCRDTRN